MKLLPFVLVTVGMAPLTSLGAWFELGGTASYYHYRNSPTSHTRGKNFGGSLGYKFLAFSALEFSYTRATTFNSDYNPIASFSTRTERDIYAAHWVQNLTPKESLFQPFFKLGGGYTDARSRTSLNITGYPEVLIDEKLSGATASTGLGLRWIIAGRLALRLEAMIQWTAQGSQKKPYRHEMGSAGITLYL